MKVKCAWCGADMGDNGAPVPAGVPADAVSHGMCDECAALSPACFLIEPELRNDLGGRVDAASDWARDEEALN